MILRLTTRHENGDRSVAPVSRPAVVWASSPAFASPVTTSIFEGARGEVRHVDETPGQPWRNKHRAQPASSAHPPHRSGLSRRDKAKIARGEVRQSGREPRGQTHQTAQAPRRAATIHTTIAQTQAEARFRGHRRLSAP